MNVQVGDIVKIAVRRWLANYLEWHEVLAVVDNGPGHRHEIQVRIIYKGVQFYYQDAILEVRPPVQETP